MRWPHAHGAIGGVALLVLTGTVAPAVQTARAAATAQRPSELSLLARVRWIDGGLGVQPPHKKQVRGRVKMPLGNQYALQTKRKQRASIGFRDGTVLHLNQQTNAVLQSHLTTVRRGEVDEVLQPGTNHRVQTAAAVAAAIGTNFDVRIAGRKSTFLVVHGAVLVKNRKGSVLVKAGQETTVTPNHKPTPPQPVDAQAATAWTTSIPTPVLGDNLLLDADGGQVVAVSSDRPSAPAANINDGRIDTSWQSAPGQTTNQFVKLGFAGSKIDNVTSILIDAGHGKAAPAATETRDFQLRYSLNSTDDADFVDLTRGTLKQNGGFQRFALRGPTRMRYLELIVRSTQGSADSVSVAEIEAVGVPDTRPVFNQPYGIAVDPQGNIDVADITGFIQRLSPEGKLLASIAAKGHNPGQLESPSGLAVDQQGTIYIVDLGKTRILTFSAAGKFLREWGSVGTAPGQFESPYGIAADQQGHVFVAEASRVEEFTTDGTYLPASSGPGQFFYGPYAVATDPQGNLYVTGNGAQVTKFSPDGTQLLRFGGYGNGPGQFGSIRGIALDQQGNIYVADSGNGRIEKFSPAGVFLLQWPTPGSTGQGSLHPLYLAVDAQGFVYVTFGQEGDGVHKYSPTGQLIAAWQ